MDSQRRRTTGALCALACTALLACGGTNDVAGGTAPPCTASSAIATSQVAIQATTFSPSCIRVAAGTTVTFTNGDSMDHTVTANDASYDSGLLAPSRTFTHLYSTAGTSPYRCVIHSGMAGTVIVQ